MDTKCSGSLAVIPAIFVSFLLLASVGEASGQEESCRDCHAGQAEWPLAPDVYRFWNGSQDVQDGGHGDEDGRPGSSCTGSSGCHDLSAAATHMNGVLETLGNPSENTAHLVEDFIATTADQPWNVAVRFNGTCAESCHLASGVSLCIGNGHAARSPYPYTPRFGEGSTPGDADGSSGIRYLAVYVDSDISTYASVDDPDYALCVSCHDPHGTGVVEPARRTNRMLRVRWLSSNELCFSCHVDVSTIDSDGDGLTDDDEVSLYFTDPSNPDTDGDGLTDGEEVTMAEGSSCPDPLLPDSDGDMLSDGDESAAGSSPCDPDSDGDGIPDYYDHYTIDPGGTQSFVEEDLRYLVQFVETMDLSLIEARNVNAAESHQRWMARRLSTAAYAVHDGDFQGALDKMSILLARIDGRPKPKDWMVDSDDKTWILARIDYLMYLLEHLK